MSVQILPAEGNFASNFGSGLGQGLSQQLPEEIKRYRLSKGLENLASKKNLSQLQKYAGLLSIPGAAEHASLLLPALQQAGLTEELQRQAAGGTQPINANIAPSKAPPSTETTHLPPREKVPTGFASPAAISEYKKNLFREPTQQEIAKGSLKYLNAGVFPEEAQQRSKQDILQNKEAQQESEKNLKTILSERMSRILQGAGLTGDYQHIAGQIQDKLLEEGKYRLHTNRETETSESVADKLIPLVEDIGKATTQIKSTGSSFKSSESKKRAFNEQKKIFDKYGFDEQFTDLAQRAAGITNLQAAMEFDPLKNPEIRKTINSLPRRPDRTLAALNEKNLNAIISKIKPEDNLLSIAGLLRDKHYSVNQFLEEAAKIPNLTDRQLRELQKPASQSFLGDIFWRSF